MSIPPPHKHPTLLRLSATTIVTLRAMIASGKASGVGGGTIVEQFYISGRIKSRSGDVKQHSADGTVRCLEHGGVHHGGKL